MPIIQVSDAMGFAAWADTETGEFFYRDPSADATLVQGVVVHEGPGYFESLPPSDPRSSEWQPPQEDSSTTEGPYSTPAQGGAMFPPPAGVPGFVPVAATGPLPTAPWLGEPGTIEYIGPVEVIGAIVETVQSALTAVLPRAWLRSGVVALPRAGLGRMVF